LEESQLIALLKTNDRAAFEKIVETYKSLVFNTALGMLQNEEDAEDISQEVFIKVFESVSDFKGASKFSTWLYRITVTKCLDAIRRKNRKKRFAFVHSLFGDDDRLKYDPPEFVHPGVQAERKEDAKLLFVAIAKLPENQKTAFVLNKVESLSYKEISEIMDLSASAVDSLLQRARKNLKKELDLILDK